MGKLTKPGHTHIFNNDLLMNDRDLAHASSEFTKIIHVLDNPRLRKKFTEYEEEANAAREWVRGLGFAALLSTALALLAVATKPVWPHEPWAKWVALVIELGGMLAAVIAASGLWLGPWKRRWLESRLMTERLRQWQFQLFVRRGQEIEASCKNPNEVPNFVKGRDRWLEDFLIGHEGHLETQIEKLTSEAGHSETWLHVMGNGYGNASVALEHVFHAYKRLRFDPQRDYALYKLRKSRDVPFWQFLKWPARLQLAALSNAATVCFAAALTCSGVLVYGYTFGIPANIELYVRTGAIAVAVIGATLRTLQEGLAPDKEIERYKDYRGRTAQLADRFEHTTDPNDRLHLMGELEIAAVDEMRGFLRTHQNSKFLLT